MTTLPAVLSPPFPFQLLTHVLPNLTHRFSPPGSPEGATVAARPWGAARKTASRESAADEEDAHRARLCTAATRRRSPAITGEPRLPPGWEPLKVYLVVNVYENLGPHVTLQHRPYVSPRLSIGHCHRSLALPLATATTHAPPSGYKNPPHSLPPSHTTAPLSEHHPKGCQGAPLLPLLPARKAASSASVTTGGRKDDDAAGRPLPSLSLPTPHPRSAQPRRFSPPGSPEGATVAARPRGAARKTAPRESAADEEDAHRARLCTAATRCRPPAITGEPRLPPEETEESIGNDKILNGASSISSSPSSQVSHICLMAKASMGSHNLEANLSHDDEDEVHEEEEELISSLHDKGEVVHRALRKNKIACSKFVEILVCAIESQKLIEMHENTILKMSALERDYADEIGSLKGELEEEQITKESLEETFSLELSRIKENHDRDLEVENDLKLKNDKLVFVNAKLLEDFEQLKNGSMVIESVLSISHDDLLVSREKLKLAHEASMSKVILEEIEELKAQVTSLKKDLRKGHEGKCKLDKMLSVQQSPNDKSGLGFISNNKKKSNSSKNKKGQVQIKDPAKITCFKCKIEGHHVRSCPLKKKPLNKKQEGKRPQVQGNAQPRVEEKPLPKKIKANAPIVEKSSEKKEKRRTCYICREKGHISSFCTIGTSSNPIIIDDVYSLRKDEVGNVFAKYVGAQSGVKKRTIWVAKPIVTNLLGPNLVGDQQAKT
ncbi:hypothetical protein QYE76_041143 [Lolium multiflorum]|uniref:CCHC-type domain-containing protein n=1 Tax=Lolium multiflorum TaxID=4521 RepID=A0AAD8WTQ0_LOLMU|nr:hypothetical protein QYE76_041143 [Lolium multiflorum]